MVGKRQNKIADNHHKTGHIQLVIETTENAVSVSQTLKDGKTYLYITDATPEKGA